MLIIILLDSELEDDGFCAERKLAFLKLCLLFIFYASNFDLLRSLPNIWIMTQISGWIIYLFLFPDSHVLWWRHMKAYLLNQWRQYHSEWMILLQSVCHSTGKPYRWTRQWGGEVFGIPVCHSWECLAPFFFRVVVSWMEFDGSSNLVQYWDSALE